MERSNLCCCNNKRKGIAATISAVLLLIVMLILILIFITTISEANKKEQGIILRSAEISRVKNTFLLLNKSLETTWFVSAVQSLFKIAEEGAVVGGQSWLSTTPYNGYNPSIPSGECTSNANPKICLPNGDSIMMLFKGELERYKDEMLKGNDYIELKPNNVQTKIGFNIDPNKIWPAYDRIIVGVENNIEMSYGDTNLNSVAETQSDVFTNFRKLIFIGWEITSSALQLNKMMTEFDCQTINRNTYCYSRHPLLKFQPNSNLLLYVGAVRDTILNENTIKNYFAQLGIDADVNSSFEYNLIGDSEDDGVVGDSDDDYHLIPSGQIPPGEGLLLHYKYEIELSDGEYYKETYVQATATEEGYTKFEKKPVTLKFTLEDYLPMISCGDYSYITQPFVTFNLYQSYPDLACFFGKIYSCGGTIIPNVKHLNWGESDENAFAIIRCQAGGLTVQNKPISS